MVVGADGAAAGGVDPLGAAEGADCGAAGIPVTEEGGTAKR